MQPFSNLKLSKTISFFGYIYTSLFTKKMVENKHKKNGKHNTIKRTK